MVIRIRCILLTRGTSAARRGTVDIRHSGVTSARSSAGRPSASMRARVGSRNASIAWRSGIVTLRALGPHVDLGPGSEHPHVPHAIGARLASVDAEGDLRQLIERVRRHPAGGAWLALEGQVLAQLGRDRAPRPDEIVVREDDGAERFEVAGDVPRDRDEGGEAAEEHGGDRQRARHAARALAPPDPAFRRDAPASVSAAPIPTRYICSALVTKMNGRLKSTAIATPSEEARARRRPRSSATRPGRRPAGASRTSSRPVARDDRPARAGRRPSAHACS